MNRVAICRRMEHTGVVPVIRAPNAEQAFLACRALHAGGVDVFEITMTVPNAPEVIREVVKQFSKDVLVGAGTVLTQKRLAPASAPAQSSSSAPVSIRRSSAQPMMPESRRFRVCSRPPRSWRPCVRGRTS